MVEGYASWLQCYIDLDPSEVVMHHSMVPPEESREPNVYLQVVQPYATYNNNNNNIEEEDDNDNGEWSVGDEYTYSILPTTTTTTTAVADSPQGHQILEFKLRLHIPESLPRHQTVQFVVEAKIQAPSPNPTDSDSDNDFDDNDDDPLTVVAKFVESGVMCEGTRAFSTRYQDHVVLRLQVPTLGGGNKSSEPPVVELVAGWAAGLEAVTLTPKLTLKPSSTTENSNSNSNSNNEYKNDNDNGGGGQGAEL